MSLKTVLPVQSYSAHISLDLLLLVSVFELTLLTLRAFADQLILVPSRLVVPAGSNALFALAEH